MSESDMICKIIEFNYSAFKFLCWYCQSLIECYSSKIEVFSFQMLCLSHLTLLLNLISSYLFFSSFLKALLVVVISLTLLLKDLVFSFNFRDHLDVFCSYCHYQCDTPHCLDLLPYRHYIDFPFYS